MLWFEKPLYNLYKAIFSWMRLKAYLTIWAGKIANTLEMMINTVPRISRYLYFKRYLFKNFSSFTVDIKR